MNTEEYILDNLSDGKIICLWNEYCIINKYYDKVVFSMSAFTDICGNNFIKLFPRIDEYFSLSHMYFSYGTIITSYDTAADAIGDIVNMRELARFVEEYHKELLED